MKPVNLTEKLATFTDHYQPRTVGEFNGHDIMVVKLKGSFVWHKHDDTDDVPRRKCTCCSSSRRVRRIRGARRRPLRGA